MLERVPRCTTERKPLIANTEKEEPVVEFSPLFPGKKYASASWMGIGLTGRNPFWVWFGLEIDR
jgi:hypothetical protein